MSALPPSGSNREKMRMQEMWRMMFQLLMPFFCGMFALNGTVMVYQAEEGKNITISWDIQTKINLSLSYLDCVLKSDVTKTLYRMHGSEKQDYQDRQFAGRVQCDRNALEEGHMRLHLLRARTDDSGDYSCKLATFGTSMIQARTFTLNVTAAESGLPAQGGTKQRPTVPQQGGLVWFVFITGAVLFAAVAVGAVACFRKKDEDRHRYSRVNN